MPSGIFSVASNGKIHHNIVAFGDSCGGNNYSGINLRDDSDNNEVINNIVIGITNGEANQGGEAVKGYGIYILTNSDDNLIQGNLIIGGGKGPFPMSTGTNLDSSSRAPRSIDGKTACLQSVCKRPSAKR